VNPYEWLEIQKTATKEEIKVAYKKMSKKYHPDIHGGNNETFLKLKECYDFLMNDDLREMFDEYGVMSMDITVLRDSKNQFFQIFATIVTNVQRVKTTDIMDFVLKQLDSVISQNKEQIQSIENTIEKISEVKTRTKVKEGFKDEISHFLKAEIDNMKNMIDLHSRNIIVAKIAKKMAEKYSYETDKQPAISIQDYQMNNTTISQWYSTTQP